MNYRLKALIVGKYGLQRHFARALGVDPAIISKVVHQYKRLDPEELKRWAELLTCKSTDIQEAENDG